MHWVGLDPVLKGTTSQHLIHVADWLPTFVGGIAGLDLGPDGYKYPVDGINQWPALTTPGAAGPRSVIVHEIGGDNRIPQEAYLDGQYKIIRHHPTIYNNDRYVCETVRGVCDCSLGWCPVPGRGPAVPPPAAETNAMAALNASPENVVPSALAPKDSTSRSSAVTMDEHNKMAVVVTGLIFRLPQVNVL